MKKRRSILVVLLMAGLIAVTPIAALGATPKPPASYYGQVLINGQPAEEGLEVTAYINGTARGNITTGANGTFGGPGTFDEKLDVRGLNGQEGHPVTFEVGNESAITTVDWSSGDHRQITVQVFECDPITAGYEPPTDIDGDGQLEDVNGDGRLGFHDVAALFNHMSNASSECHDFNGNGHIDFDDIVSLFHEV